MSKYIKNLDKNFFGDGYVTLFEENFDGWIPNFSGSNSLEIILRTNLIIDSIIKFLSSMFSRIYSFEVTRMKVAVRKINGRSLYCNKINLHLLKPHFWSVLEKDIINFYSLHLIKLLDWELSPTNSIATQEYWLSEIQDFESYFENLILDRVDLILLCNVFFHTGILTYLKATEDSGLSISVNSIMQDFKGINRILRTPYKLKEAINSCSSTDQTHISNQIIKEYRKMRKSW